MRRGNGVHSWTVFSATSPYAKRVGRGARPAMKKQPAVERRSSTEKLTILVVSPVEEDHLSLQAIFGHPTHSTCMLFNARDPVSAFALLKQYDIDVVICEQELVPGTWIDVLTHLKALPNAPSLIVTSRLADWHLWAKALNLGAWDVLAKPFDRAELIRSVQSAAQHWHDQIHIHPTVKMMSAAS
jgi:DNA-binding NtrC family response regulator